MLLVCEMWRTLTLLHLKNYFDFYYYKIDVFVIGLYYSFCRITECVIRLYYKIIKNVIIKNKNSKNKSEGSGNLTDCVTNVGTTKICK